MRGLDFPLDFGGEKIFSTQINCTKRWITTYENVTSTHSVIDSEHRKFLLELRLRILAHGGFLINLHELVRANPLHPRSVRSQCFMKSTSIFCSMSHIMRIKSEFRSSSYPLLFYKACLTLSKFSRSHGSHLNGSGSIFLPPSFSSISCQANNAEK